MLGSPQTYFQVVCKKTALKTLKDDKNYWIKITNLTGRPLSQSLYELE